MELINEVFREMKAPLKGAKIAVLGLGFKANSGDLRNTPAEPIVRGLLEHGADVIAQDPFVQFDEVYQIFPKLACTRKVEEAVRGASCTVIVTDHLEYRGLTASHLKKLMSSPCAVIDSRHIINPHEAVAAHVIFRGLGKPRRIA
jgi:UDP-N-acetyl-D-mannosaminuronic acid dehydrogenase